IGSLVAGASTDHAIRSDKSTTLVARWSGGAFRQDLGASLKVDGSEVLTSDNAGTAALATPSLSGGVVGLFLDDADKNGKTDLGLAYSTSFIAFSDVFIDTATPKFVELSLTAGSEDTSIVGQKILMSNYPSSQGLVNIFFQ